MGWRKMIALLRLNVHKFPFCGSEDGSKILQQVAKQRHLENGETGGGYGGKAKGLSSDDLD